MLKEATAEEAAAEMEKPVEAPVNLAREDEFFRIDKKFPRRVPEWDQVC
jgi:hypothetical protein